MHKSSSSTIISKPTIVIDLDDTLVYVTPLPPNNSKIKNYFPIHVKRRTFYVQKRPCLQYFLDQLSKVYDIYIFTSSDKEYADLIIDKILPNLNKKHRFYKDSCSSIYGYYIKDLQLIGRPLNKTLLIDDSAGSSLKNPKNLIKVKPWNGESNDRVLFYLLKVLQSIALEKDLRISFLEAVKKYKYDGIGSF